ncbi:universal stress protein [Pedococcus sp. 2YAF34]|uniref:universal stress protein n=1 Tax=Pedococcus sp. 2YAF34 TaxID=3233032 RepID=UPI003F9B86E7
MDTTHRPVIVGIDLSGTSDLALDWAAEEASRRATPLVVVHTYSAMGYPAVRAGVPGAPLPPDLDRVFRETALEACSEAAEKVRAGHPGLAVSTVTSTGSPGEALVDASKEAALVVVGARGLGAVRGMVLGSVSTHVAAHAHCPVVVVHEAPTHSLGDARVVVGVDGSEVSAAAIRFAFEQADSRGVGVTVAHTWQLDSVEGAAAAMAWSVDMDEINEEERSLVAEAVAGFAEQYPSVDVRRVVTQGHPVHELARLSENAALLVVGTRGRGAVSGWLAGSVSQSLIRAAHCPVAVVHPDPESAHAAAHHAGDGEGFRLPVPPVRERL